MTTRRRRASAGGGAPSPRLATFVVLVTLAALASPTRAHDSTTQLQHTDTCAALTSSSQVNVHLFMDQRVGGTKAVVSLRAVVETLGERALSLVIDYVNSTAASLSDDEELADRLQLCARAIYPRSAQWFNFTYCMSKDFDLVPDNAHDCATQHSLDYAKLRACADDDEQGAKLLRSSLSAAAQHAVVQSPTIFINGELYKSTIDAQPLFDATCDGAANNSWWHKNGKLVGILSVVVGLPIVAVAALGGFMLYKRLKSPRRQHVNRDYLDEESDSFLVE